MLLIYGEVRCKSQDFLDIYTDCSLQRCLLNRRTFAEVSQRALDTNSILSVFNNRGK